MSFSRVLPATRKKTCRALAIFDGRLARPSTVPVLVAGPFRSSFTWSRAEVCRYCVRAVSHRELASARTSLICSSFLRCSYKYGERYRLLWLLRCSFRVAQHRRVSCSLLSNDIKLPVSDLFIRTCTGSFVGLSRNDASDVSRWQFAIIFCFLEIVGQRNWPGKECTVPRRRLQYPRVMSQTPYRLYSSLSAILIEQYPFLVNVED